MTRRNAKYASHDDSTRKSYASPRLTVYGKLTELTNGGNQNDTDGLSASGSSGFAAP
jgi:hypothetical protein